MPILAWIASLFAPATALVKEFHLSDADRMAMENKMAEIQAATSAKFVELEEEKLKLQEVEANSSNWLVAAWRPMCSIVIVTIILLASFGLAHPDASFYDLAKWFLCGYTGARTVDKAITSIPAIVKKIKDRE